MSRVFTYVSDIIEAIRLLIETAPERCEDIPLNDSLSPVAPWRTVNIGNSVPVKLMYFISAIEKATGKTAKLNLMDMQDSDVAETWADTSLSEDLTGFTPQTVLVDGIKRFSEWNQAHYHKK